VDAALNAKKGTIDAKRIVAQFYKFSDAPVVPITLTSVKKFIYQWVAEHSGSSKSLDKVVRAIKVHCLCSRIPWLDDADAFALKTTVHQIKFSDVHEVSRRSPLKYSMLVRISEGFNPATRRHALLLVLFWTAYEGALRSDELLGGRSIGDVTWETSPLSFSLSLRRTKTHRKGPPQKVVYYYHDTPNNAYKYMRNYFSLNHLWEAKSSRLLFPSLYKTKVPTSVSAKWFSQQIKTAVAGIGFSPTTYSAHSFRAGLATDLFNTKAPLETVQWAGRWKSLCALEYYRDQVTRGQKVQHALDKIRKNFIKGGV
jgi:hypothetical protein